MKKALFSLALMATMFASTAFAGPVGNSFSNEENIGLNVISGMTGKGPYSSVVSNFVPDMAKKYTEQAHKESAANIVKEVGNISDVKLAGATRVYNDRMVYQSDRLVFIGKSDKVGLVGVDMVFVPSGNQMKIAAVGFRPVEIKAAAPQQAR